MKKRKYIGNRNFVMYAQKDLLMMTTMKNVIKSEIIVILQESIAELHIISSIYDIKNTKRNSCSIS